MCPIYAYLALVLVITAVETGCYSVSYSVDHMDQASKPKNSNSFFGSQVFLGVIIRRFWRAILSLNRCSYLALMHLNCVNPVLILLWVFLSHLVFLFVIQSIYRNTLLQLKLRWMKLSFEKTKLKPSSWNKLFIFNANIFKKY